MKKESDFVIYCMERYRYFKGLSGAEEEKIFEKYPSAREENVYVLTELVGDELEILDPYGGSLQSYGLCYETMRKSIIKLVKLLNEGE